MPLLTRCRSALTAAATPLRQPIGPGSEARKILYSRLTMTVKVLEETQVVRGTVVQCPDMYDNARANRLYHRAIRGCVLDLGAYRLSLGDMWVVMTDSLGNYRGRWRAYPVSGKPQAFQAAADTFDLNIYDRNMVQNPSRYFTRYRLGTELHNLARR